MERIVTNGKVSFLCFISEAHGIESVVYSGNRSTQCSRIVVNSGKDHTKAETFSLDGPFNDFAF